MQAFILAGGFATRLWPLTEKRAKPLLPLAGKPIITHLLERIPEGIPVTVSTNAAFGEAFQEWAKETERPNLSIVIERTTKDDEKLGALGAVAAWVKEEGIKEDVLLLTGDNYFGFDLQRFLDAVPAGTPALAACDIGDLEQAKAFGTVIPAKDQKHVSAFEEKPKDPKSSLVSTGCSLLPAATLPILLEYAAEHPDNVGGIFEEFLRRKLQVAYVSFAEPWFDIGSFASYLEATRALVGEEVFLGKGATSSGARLTGGVVIGDGSRVVGGVLSGTVLFERCIVEDCILEDCILDDDCVLRGIDLTGKMLRAGTVLEKP
jgi:glucose-1-phosphate thymidylyltransferase